MKIRYFSICILFPLVWACSDKDSPTPVNYGNLKILGLTASTDTIHAWDTTTLRVKTNVPFELVQWEANHGTLLGSGASIVYSAGSCCLGTNTITCTVQSLNEKDTASIKIHVLPYVIPK